MEHEHHNQTIPHFNEIFVGHTPTQLINKESIPTKFSNLWMLDTGIFYISGKLSIMNIDTKEFWQSSSKENKKH